MTETRIRCPHNKRTRVPMSLRLQLYVRDKWRCRYIGAQLRCPAAVRFSSLFLFYLNLKQLARPRWKQWSEPRVIPCQPGNQPKTALRSRATHLKDPTLRASESG